MNDAAKILGFVAALVIGNFVYALAVHPHESAVIWIYRSYFMGVGAVSAFFFGPQRTK